MVHGAQTASGVVYQKVDAMEVLQHLFYFVLVTAEVAHVKRDANYVRRLELALRQASVSHFFQLLFVSAGEYQPCSSNRKIVRQRFADAR